MLIKHIKKGQLKDTLGLFSYYGPVIQGSGIVLYNNLKIYFIIMPISQPYFNNKSN